MKNTRINSIVTLRLCTFLTALFLTCAQAYAQALPEKLSEKSRIVAEEANISFPFPSPKPDLSVSTYVGDMAEHKTVYEDTLLKIARDNKLGYVEIRAANPGVDPWLPGANKNIILPARHLLPEAPRQGIVVNLPEMRLYAFLDAQKDPITFPIGIGRTGLNTPVGTTYITKIKEDPIWFPTARMREEDPSLPKAVGPGPDNPLGTHALYLGWPTFLIHGTSEPWGIGRRVSSGCIRLYPEDIKILHRKVHEGMRVTIVDQAVKARWVDGRLYVEAHIGQEYANKMEESGDQPPLDISADDMRLVLEKAGHHFEKINWGLLRKVLTERKGYPVAITPLISDKDDGLTQAASTY